MSKQVDTIHYLELFILAVFSGGAKKKIFSVLVLSYCTYTARTVYSNSFSSDKIRLRWVTMEQPDANQNGVWAAIVQGTMRPKHKLGFHMLLFSTLNDSVWTMSEINIYSGFIMKWSTTQEVSVFVYLEKRYMRFNY